MDSPRLLIHGLGSLGPLSVEAGEVLALLGPNGCGKTRLLRSLMGLVPGPAAAVDGRDTARLGPAERLARGVVLCPQGRHLFGDMSVAENLRLGAWQRRDRAAIQADLVRIEARFPWIRARRARAAGTLSGGEQQVVALGRALMARPRVLLLDEPTIGLSPAAVGEIAGWVAEEAACGPAVLVAEQNVAFLRLVASRLLVFSAGGRLSLEPVCSLGEGRDMGLAAWSLVGTEASRE